MDLTFTSLSWWATNKVYQGEIPGVTLDHKHVKLCSKLALGLLAQMGRVLGLSWGASPKIIVWAYRSLILPALEYDCIV